MSFYDITYNTQANRLTPVKKRLPKFLAWLYSILSPMQWLHDVIFGSYIDGSPEGFFDSAQFYVAPDRVIMIDNTVWESLNATPKLGSVSNPFDDPTKWQKIQEVYIGVNERLKYNAQLIIFEYALNHWFQNTGAPDQIYIENNVTDSDFYIVGEADGLSASLSVLELFATEYVGTDFTPGTQYDYTIYVPAGLWFTLGANDTDRENVVRNIANKYNAAGMQYSVEAF